jgi:hypothetical protein
MMQVLGIREVQVFVTSILLGLGIAWLSSRSTKPTEPNWPTRLYVFILVLGPMRRYAKSRTSFPAREQFLAAFFVWFFILFVAGVTLLPCGRRAC